VPAQHEMRDWIPCGYDRWPSVLCRYWMKPSPYLKYLNAENACLCLKIRKSRSSEGPRPREST
jgi:hypothetical protein